MQVALESHQGFIFACEGDPGVGQTTQACTHVRFLFSCACVTQGPTFPPQKLCYRSLFYFFAKTFAVCLHYQRRCSGGRLAIWKSLTILLSKLQFTAKMAKSLSDGIWYPGCALHSKLLCCLPSKLVPTNFEWPSLQQRFMPVFLLKKKNRLFLV